MTSNLVCVHAVVRATSPPGREQRDRPAPTIIRHGRLAALVSPQRSERVRPTRAALHTHEEVVAQAHRDGPVVPLRFGTVLPAESVVTELLRPRQQEFESLLQDLEGKDEYRIRVRYLPDVPLREVVQRNRRLQRMRSRAQADQIRLGALVFDELEALADHDAAVFLGRILPCVVTAERLPDRVKDVAVHVALLVERSSVPDLEDAVDSYAANQAGRVEVEMVGPIAAWDFISAEPGAA